MKKLIAWIPGFAMVALILDSSTATAGALEGVELVLRTALPALFPFFVLSAMMLPACTKLRFSLLGRLLGVPSGWESVFLLGCIGGYPVGAQCVAQGYSRGKLSRQDGERMLGFCTNCGPSFLFGILTACFSGPWVSLMVYLVGILSAFFTALIWQGGSDASATPPDLPPVSLSEAVQQGLRSMAAVSAWIILGRIVLSFLEKYLLGRLPSLLRLVCIGALELTNGCLNLGMFPEALRFPAACAMTTFGGLCVWLQVLSICNRAGLRGTQYLPQKLTQSAIALLLSLILAADPGRLWILLLCAGIGILSKKTVEISGSMLYNRGN